MTSFTPHMGFVDKRFTDMAFDEAQRDTWVAAMETAAASLDSSFTSWKPQVEESLHSVRLELSKLNSFFNREAKESSTTKPGVLSIKSAPPRSPFDIATNDPSGHHTDNCNRDCGYGSVYIHTHDPVKDTIHSTVPSPPPNVAAHMEFSSDRDTYRAHHSASQSPRLPTRKLPKLNFPSFDGDNPKLCKSRCENYFDMYYRG
jgi:hypothetical protein